MQHLIQKRSVEAKRYTSSCSMGQSSSTGIRKEICRNSRYQIRSTIHSSSNHEIDDEFDIRIDGKSDFTSDLPDECLACVFHCLSSVDRKNCSLVCRRWLQVEGQSRHRLTLNARADILPFIPALLIRFDSIRRLALRCDRRSMSISDESLHLISIRCVGLTRLKLRGCREITDSGMMNFARNCKNLKKLSCGSCNFGSRGLNAVLDYCPSLEELTVKRLRGINDGNSTALIGPGIAAASLKVLCLKELHNGQYFEPLLVGSKQLRTLKLFRCLGDWDKLLRMVGDENPNLVEIHLERIQLSDKGLSSISSCLKLEVFFLVKIPECTNIGLAGCIENFRLLRKLHIDGWRTNRIGDEGLIAVAKKCPNLQELVLIGVNPTSSSLSVLASNCKKLERLALCGSDSVGDAEIFSIAESCTALRKLCIKGCPINDSSLQIFAWGCPNLVKMKVKKCSGVTGEIRGWLKTHRKSLIVSLGQNESESLEVIASDTGEVGVDSTSDLLSNSNARVSSLKPRFGLFSGRSLVPCTFRRW